MIGLDINCLMSSCRNINGYKFFDFFIKTIYNIYRKVKKGGIKMFFDDFDLGFSPEELEEFFDEDYLEDAENFYKEEGTDYQAFFYTDIDR